MKNYEDYLNENIEVLNFIKENNIVEEIKNADNEAKSLANMEGQQFLHSYRYSKVYDLLMDNNLGRDNVFKIVNLLENKYSKDIYELIDDSLSFDVEIS